MSTILLPTDFSPAAAHTARRAAALASRFGSRLVLLHVLTPVDQALAAPEDVLELRRLKARTELERFAAAHVPDAQLALMEGDPAASIVAAARRRAAALIMMPTRGCGPFRRFILGSVTAKVLHDAHCPVWTTEHVESMDAAQPLRLETVVCALDLLNGCERVLRFSEEIAAGAGARLVVVHAIPSLAYNPETYYLEADLRRVLKTQAAEKIHRLLGAEADTVVEGGPVAAVVRSAAEDARAGLIVIGRAAANGVIGRLRTHSYAIIREAPCPVVSV
ncbi:MAG: universal stress protein [Bryobacteraceae bacterium]